MMDPQNFDPLAPHTINSYVWQGRNQNLTGTRLLARTASFRPASQTADKRLKLPHGFIAVVRPMLFQIVTDAL